MVSKKEELKALSDIKNILKNLGSDSYVGVALEGCLEIAEENIECDFLCSMKQRCDSANEELSKCKRELEEYRSTAKLFKETAEENKDLREENKKWFCQYQEQTTRADKAESEIVFLKAKLYDLICK